MKTREYMESEKCRVKPQCRKKPKSQNEKWGLNAKCGLLHGYDKVTKPNVYDL